MAEYKGRTRDLLVMQVDSEDSEATGDVNIGFGSTSNYQVAGVQKAAQFVLMMLTTRRGSVIHDPEYGTTFWDNLRSGNLVDEEIVMSQFKAAEEEILDYQNTFRRQQIDDNDELVSSLELLDYSLEGATLNLRIAISTEAGDSREYLTPVPYVLN